MCDIKKRDAAPATPGVTVLAAILPVLRGGTYNLCSYSTIHG